MDLSSVMNAAGPEDGADAQPSVPACASPSPQDHTSTLQELKDLYEAAKRDQEALERRHTTIQQQLKAIRAENEYLIGELGQYAPSDLESDQSDVEFAPPRPTQLPRSLSARRGRRERPTSATATQNKKARGREEGSGRNPKRKRPTGPSSSSTKSGSAKARSKKPKIAAAE